MIVNSSLGRYGRLGNQLFQVAGLIGIAKRSNQPWAIPLWRNYDHAERFGSTEDIDVYKYFVHEFPQMPTDVPFTQRTYTFGYHHIVLPHGHWDIHGHFQSPKYFMHCIDEVRRWLRMKNECRPNEYTAIHVRLGDYDDRYHPRLTMDYYRAAMQHIPGPYLIFSDDLRAAMQMFGHSTGPDNRFVYATNDNYLEDFAHMKACQHFIIGNSSFSLMAAILANQPSKQVVAPSNWFGPAWHDPVGMAKDIYDEAWIVI